MKLDSYRYQWSFNLSIFLPGIMMIIVWIGDVKYTWAIRRPFKLQRETPFAPPDGYIWKENNRE
jgi:hypothetical protein